MAEKKLTYAVLPGSSFKYKNVKRKRKFDKKGSYAKLSVNKYGYAEIKLHLYDEELKMWFDDEKNWNEFKYADSVWKQLKNKKKAFALYNEDISQIEL